MIELRTHTPKCRLDPGLKYPVFQGLFGAAGAQLVRLLFESILHRAAACLSGLVGGNGLPAYLDVGLQRLHAFVGPA
ncbi:hypothetical protein [Pelagibacterium sp.]|uniref:hypothetical protein n=1 Tax=Pelagibacterium sp. TaxID=1967288 RepID=UPI003BAD9521